MENNTPLTRDRAASSGRLVVFFVLIGMAPATVVADYNVSRNGVTWTASFEGNDLPEFTDPAWIEFDDNEFAARSSDGDIYSIVSGSTGVASAFEISDTTWNNGSAARTVEFRARVPDAEFLATDGAASMILGVNDTAYDLRLYPDKVAYNGAEGLLNPANVVNLNMTEFHTFRMVVDQNAANSFKLYIDSNPVPALQTSSYWFISPGFDKLVFGDISTGGESGKSDWDFISWNATGAFGFGLSGDYNGDRAVDAADYTVWRDSLGSTTELAADGDGDGQVGPGDYDVWKENFGGGGGSGAVTSVVPEPSTLLLLALTMFVGATRRIRID